MNRTEGGGRAVWALLAVGLALLGVAGWAVATAETDREFHHLAAPVPDDLLITLTRTQCFGNVCPAYVVSVDGHGSVVFDGFANIAVPGWRRYRVKEAEVARLYRTMLESGFRRLRDVYEAPTTDQPWVITMLRANGTTKEVRHFSGPDDDTAPAALTQIEGLIEQVAEVAPLVDPR